MNPGIQSPSGEDPSEKEMATRSSFLAWEIPWTEESGRLPFMGSQKSQTQLSDSTTTKRQEASPCSVAKSYPTLL